MMTRAQHYNKKKMPNICSMKKNFNVLHNHAFSNKYVQSIHWVFQGIFVCSIFHFFDPKMGPKPRKKLHFGEPMFRNWFPEPSKRAHCDRKRGSKEPVPRGYPVFISQCFADLFDQRQEEVQDCKKKKKGGCGSLCEGQYTSFTRFVQLDEHKVEMSNHLHSLLQDTIEDHPASTSARLLDLPNHPLLLRFFLYRSSRHQLLTPPIHFKFLSPSYCLPHAARHPSRCVIFLD